MPPPAPGTRAGAQETRAAERGCFGSSAARWQHGAPGRSALLGAIPRGHCSRGGATRKTQVGRACAAPSRSRPPSSPTAARRWQAAQPRQEVPFLSVLYGVQLFSWPNCRLTCSSTKSSRDPGTFPRAPPRSVFPSHSTSPVDVTPWGHVGRP